MFPPMSDELRSCMHVAMDLSIPSLAPLTTLSASAPEFVPESQSLERKLQLATESTREMLSQTLRSETDLRFQLDRASAAESSIQSSRKLVQFLNSTVTTLKAEMAAQRESLTMSCEDMRSLCTSREGMPKADNPSEPVVFELPDGDTSEASSSTHQLIPCFPSCTLSLAAILVAWHSVVIAVASQVQRAEFLRTKSICSILLMHWLFYVARAHDASNLVWSKFNRRSSLCLKQCFIDIALLVRLNAFKAQLRCAWASRYRRLTMLRRAIGAWCRYASFAKIVSVFIRTFGFDHNDPRVVGRIADLENSATTSAFLDGFRS